MEHGFITLIVDEHIACMKQIKRRFKRDGATKVEATKDGDGTYTIVATFPD